jgi:hypothetical protein
MTNTLAGAIGAVIPDASRNTIQIAVQISNIDECARYCRRLSSRSATTAKPRGRCSRADKTNTLRRKG